MCCNENCANCVCKHVATCVWMCPGACACVCEYLLAPTMPCISLVINFFLLPCYGLNSFQKLSTLCTRCYNKETPIYKPKLSEKRTKTAVLDLIDRLQRGYTIAQHQPQIIVAHSNASGNSDVATSHWLESGSYLQARRNAFILPYSASARRTEYFDTKLNVWGLFKPIYRRFF